MDATLSFDMASDDLFFTGVVGHFICQSRDVLCCHGHLLRCGMRITSLGGQVLFKWECGKYVIQRVCVSITNEKGFYEHDVSLFLFINGFFDGRVNYQAVSDYFECYI